MASQSTPKQSNKEGRDLACIIAALQSSRTKLDVDYDVFMRLDGAPTKQAAQMRLYRLGKSLGVELTSGRAAGIKAPKGQTTAITAGREKLATARSNIDEEEKSEEDECEERSPKKAKIDKASSGLVKFEYGVTAQSGSIGNGEERV